MSIEIERKFLVRDDGWRALAAGGQRLRQGYLANTARCSLRIRLAGERAWLSAKAVQRGPARAEFEYEIPAADARAMLQVFAEGPLIEKRRHRVVVERHCFELDEFEGDNAGLVLAEIELAAADQPFPRPSWLGDEVTDDARFYNFALAARPFSSWPPAARAAVSAGQAPAPEPA